MKQQLDPRIVRCTVQVCSELAVKHLYYIEGLLTPRKACSLNLAQGPFLAKYMEMSALSQGYRRSIECSLSAHMCTIKIAKITAQFTCRRSTGW